MQILYHPDIISKLYTSFTSKFDNIERDEESNSVINSLENIAFHRVCHLLTKDENSEELLDNIPMQVAGTLYQYCNDPHIVDLGTFQPEEIPNKTVKDEVLQLCTKGTFVPFLLVVSHDDLEMTDNFMVTVFGIGEKPEENFAMMCIDIKEYIKNLDLSKRNAAVVMYPMIFDVPRNCIASTGEPNAMHIRIFTKKETDEVSEKE